MNTDARRAVFCAVMGAEDCMDAFERLLKLQLKARTAAWFQYEVQGSIERLKQPLVTVGAAYKSAGSTSCPSASSMTDDRVSVEPGAQCSSVSVMPRPRLLDAET